MVYRFPTSWVHLYIGMVLFGQAHLVLPLVVSALRHAFAKGLGEQNHGTGELIDLAVQSEHNWQDIQAANGMILPPNKYIGIFAKLRIKPTAETAKYSFGCFHRF
ncbi:hypothetical protein [Neisseria dentiae]|uniref:hypothetical protein n=1 Tax=Neisseria dentiae TaxID=194197 RepID=UPI00359F4626